jgi:hypothetical protein
MPSLIGLLVATGLTAVFYVWRRPVLRRSRTEAFAFVCLYCLSLGLALRFGGRTYPGIYFPDSSFLNSLLNGNGIFTDIGYKAVVVAWAADVLRILLRPPIRSGVELALRVLKWLAVGLAVSIAIYGFVWAAKLQRLPW